MKIAEQHALVMMDPSQEHHPALERAKSMVAAASHRENITLSILISASSSNLKKNKQQTGFYFTDQWVTETIVAPLDKLQVNYSILYSWSDDFSQNIIDISTKQSTTMIILPFYGNIPAHVFNDEKWKLLRNSNQPILIAFQRDQAVSGIILSTIKYQDNSYLERNQQIIDSAQSLAESFRMKHHVVNAYADSAEYPDRVKIASFANVDNAQVHVKIGAAEDVICDVAKNIDPDVVLISSQRRKGLKGVLIGNTVEKIIERVGRDVLII